MIPTPKTTATFTVWYRFRPSKRWVRLAGCRNAGDAQAALESFLAKQRTKRPRPGVDTWIEQVDAGEVPNEGAAF